VILEGEVHSLGREVSDNVGEVTSPERGKALLLVDSAKAINDTLVSVFSGHILVGILDLKKHLNSLNRSDDGLRNSGRKHHQS
jgi:hypothetical protein